MFRPSRVLPWLLLLLAMLVGPIGLVGCGSSSKQSTTATGATASSGAGLTSSAPNASGSLKVFAAASLTESFTDEQSALKASEPGLSVVYNFAGSGALVTQIQQGAPVDVVATADTSSMKKLTDAGLVEAPTTFARNKLEILVEPGNPKRIKTLADLARRDIKLVLEDATVPAGKYSAKALKTAGVTVHPVSLEADVKSAVAKVTSGEADATVVYVSDVKAAASRGTGVPIPDAQNVVAEYPIAIVKTTKNHAGAAAFVGAITKGSGQQALRSHGFLAAG